MTTKPTIVCVMRALSPTRTDLPATIYTRGRSGKPTFVKQQHLTPEVRRALGDDLRAYFDADFIDGTWFVGRRLPCQLSW